MRSRRAALGMLTAILIVACGNLPLPDQAPPEVALTTYLDALKAGDCERARSFGTATFVVGNGELCGVLDVIVFTPLTEPATPQDGEVIYSTTLTTRSGDVSMPDGDHTWFFSLHRQPDGAWRIASGGSGP